MARYDANVRCVSPNLRRSHPRARYVGLLLPSSATRVTNRGQPGIRQRIQGTLLTAFGL
jgi:hypothetical protein